jgi:rubrerythrin
MINNPDAPIVSRYFEEACDQNIYDALVLADRMIDLAARGDRDREDVGCGILYGILRDAGYKLKKKAEQEKQAHIRKGLWKKRKDPFSSDNAVNPIAGRMDSVSGLQGLKTQRNLLAAFMEESRSSHRYACFASRAEEEGYMQIAGVLKETAAQEKGHARRFFSFLEKSVEEEMGECASENIGATFDNLLAAADAEHYEHTIMYPSFAKIARAESLPLIASVFEAVSVAERQHEKRFRKLAANIEAGMVFKRDQETVWRCMNCGFMHESREAPAVCPACDHSCNYFELYYENW